MEQSYNNKRIAGKEKLAKYRKAILDKQKWTNELPQGEGPLNGMGIQNTLLGNESSPTGQFLI